MSPELRQVLAVFGGLIAAHLSGDPVPCALAHRGDPPPAFSLAVPATPCCHDHLEELEA